jgi:stage IV sporulation protein B
MKKGGKKARPGAVLLALTAIFAFVLCWSTVIWKNRSEAAVLCLAEEKTVVPVGRAVGMKLFSRGVLVVGLSQVETEEGAVMPAQACGLKTGDIITQINQETVKDIDQVSGLLQELRGESMSLQVLRGGKTVDLSGEAVQCVADGSYKLGAWLRDSMAGIGTVTWYDPDTGSFAALGHGISDLDTGLLMPIRSGGIMAATITGVEKGESGSPGQLHGTFDLTEDLGTLTVNSDCGVFGQAEEAWTGDPVPIARRSQVKVGEAQILANVEGDQVETFQVEIQRIYPQGLSQGRDMMIRITDPALLEKTGGIVPGMSGCPILQNGRLVGAVTHVLIQDPTRGYAILAESMMEMTD